MHTKWYLISGLYLVAMVAFAQQTSIHDLLLDQMAGTWVLRGTIEGKETVHDVDAHWILAHAYMQFREVSREKDSTGAPVYEALVTIGWDERSKEYACLWLDNTGAGGLIGQAIAHAKRESGRIAFLFKGSDGSLFHTTFVRDAKTDTWQWVMDGEDNGKLQPFARVSLERK